MAAGREADAVAVTERNLERSHDPVGGHCSADCSGKNISPLRIPAMPNTYRAVQVTAPGKFELLERELRPPPPGTARIRVEACGVCHSDSMTVEGLYPGISFPRVPGHEIAG